MADIDLRTFDDESFVIHFGGKSAEMSAFTFGNALVEITEALRAINHDLNPGYSFDVSIEALGPGSFRAKLRTLKAPLGNLFSGASVLTIVLGVFTNFLYDALKPSDKIIVQVTDDNVIIQHGNDRVIVPKAVAEATKKVQSSPAVARHVRRTMELLEADKSVTSFGLTPRLTDPSPAINIPRNLFEIIRENVSEPSVDGKRSITVEATLSVHKAIFARSKRKWEFVWNGFKISAPILDETFFDRLERRDVSLRQGDAFKAKLRIHQSFDSFTATWMNASYEVLEVGDIVSRRPDQILADF